MARVWRLLSQTVGHGQTVFKNKKEIPESSGHTQITADVLMGLGQNDAERGGIDSVSRLKSNTPSRLASAAAKWFRGGRPLAASR